MNYEDYIEQGLNGEAPLKLILRGSIQNSGNEKVGDKKLAESKIRELAAENPSHYYMVYSVPLDVDLTTLSHYPSIAISGDDLKD